MRADKTIGSTASHRTVENNQIYMLDGLDGWMAWLGLDISKNTTTTRAPSGANKHHDHDHVGQNAAESSITS